MVDYDIDDLIDSIYNHTGNKGSLPNVILDNLEVKFLKGLADGKSLEEINSIIKNFSETETFNTVSMRLLEKLEAFTLPHAILKVIKMKLIEF